MNNGFCWVVVSKRLAGPRDDVFSLKMVEGILFLGIPGVIQCYQQLQVFFAQVSHVNLLLFEGIS